MKAFENSFGNVAVEREEGCRGEFTLFAVGEQWQQSLERLVATYDRCVGDGCLCNNGIFAVHGGDDEVKLCVGFVVTQPVEDFGFCVYGKFVELGGHLGNNVFACHGDSVEECRVSIGCVAVAERLEDVFRGLRRFCFEQQAKAGTTQGRLFAFQKTLCFFCHGFTVA